MNPHVAYPASNQLGEGPVWSTEEQALYWIDIKRPAFQRWEPATGDYQQWELPSPIGSMALRKEGGAILALQDGIHLFEFESESLTLLADPESHLPENRFNDGKCDPRGCFWAGTMSMQEKGRVGSLYRLDQDHSWKMVRPGSIISNGLGWSPDQRTMYFTDSGTQSIYAMDYDADTSEVSNERVLVRDTDCFPDGLTVDSEGYLWSAKWDGWRVVRYSPDGQIDRTIELPVQRPHQRNVWRSGPKPALYHLCLGPTECRCTDETSLGRTCVCGGCGGERPGGSSLWGVKVWVPHSLRNFVIP